MEEKIKSAANEIVKKISELPAGSEFVIGDYFNEYKFENEENFKLIKEVLSLCESSNVKIENIQAGMILGMPWVYKYKKNN
jgi:2C-methyl-D-erythritol 2,4-cyclodiphosphate synthase